MSDYYWVTKPGIIYGNAVTVIGGFLLAWWNIGTNGMAAGFPTAKFILTLLGISLIMASSCVLNNYIDRDIDAKMERTRERAFVRGRLSGRTMIIYAIVLGLAGFLALLLHANTLTAGVAFVGYLDYVVFYSLLAKRHTVHGTIVGSIAGAVPPVVGYCALTNQLDAGAITLFAILVLWQMPHFYAIGIRRLKDYKDAGIPIMPARYSLRITKINMLFYIIAFTLAAGMLSMLGYTGTAYFIVATAFGFAWLLLCIRGFWVSEAGTEHWARTMFKFSLITLMAIFIMMSLPLK